MAKKKYLKIILPTKLRPKTDQNFLISLVGKWSPNGRGDHLPTNDIKKFWSVFGRNLVGNYRPFGDQILLVGKWSVIYQPIDFLSVK